MDFPEIAYLLSYDYRSVFLDVATYAKNCQIYGWKYNRKMMHLFEMLLTAQENEESVDSITNGKESLEFAIQFLKKTYRWRDYFITMGHFIVFLMFTALLCEFFHPNSIISVQVYLRQILLFLVVIVASPISRRYGKGKVNWVAALPILLIYVILIGLLEEVSLSSEQFFNISHVVLIVYMSIIGFVYWCKKTIMKETQEKYNSYLRQKQYAKLINHYHEGGIQTWQELLQRERKVLQNNWRNLLILDVILIVVAMFILWYAHLGSYIRWGLFSMLLLGIATLYGHVQFYEQKIKNMKSFEQEN